MKATKRFYHTSLFLSAILLSGIGIVKYTDNNFPSNPGRLIVDGAPRPPSTGELAGWGSSEGIAVASEIGSGSAGKALDNESKSSPMVLRCPAPSTGVSPPTDLTAIPPLEAAVLGFALHARRGAIHGAALAADGGCRSCAVFPFALAQSRAGVSGFVRLCVDDHRAEWSFVPKL